MSHHEYFRLPDGTRVSRGEIMAQVRDVMRSEVEEYANGWRRVTVHHGDIETDEESTRIQGLCDAVRYVLAGSYSCVATNDSHCWRIPPHLVDVAPLIVREVEEANPGWWRIEAPGVEVLG